MTDSGTSEGLQQLPAVARSESRPPEGLGPNGLALWREFSTDGKPVDEEFLHLCREADRIDAHMKTILLKIKAQGLAPQRRALGMTIETLADLTDVNPRRLEAIENGTEIPDEATMDALEAVTMPLLAPLFAEYLRTGGVNRPRSARDWALQHLLQRYG